jgi:rubredoxin
MSEYRCIVCGHIYDPAEGDATQGISPGTPFEELPETWVCPECKSPKSQYEKM